MSKSIDEIEEPLHIEGPLVLGEYDEWTTLTGKLCIKDNDDQIQESGIMRRESSGNVVIDQINLPGILMSTGDRTVVLPQIPRSILCSDDSGKPYHVQINSPGALEFDPKTRRMFWKERQPKPRFYLFCYEGDLDTLRFAQEDESENLIFDRDPVCTEENGKYYNECGEFTPPRAGRYRFFASITLGGRSKRGTGSCMFTIIDRNSDDKVLYSKVIIPPLSKTASYTIECPSVDIYINKTSRVAIQLSGCPPGVTVVDRSSVSNRLSITEQPVYQRY